MIDKSQFKELMHELMPNTELNADGLPSSQTIAKPLVIRSDFAFDPEKECYCSLCERYYKNYKRFVMHMKKQKHFV